MQASFKKVDKRRIALTFQEAQVSEISISPLAETLLAPAILPRGSINHQILMFIKELELKFPLRGALTSIGGGCLKEVLRTAILASHAPRGPINII